MIECTGKNILDMQSNNESLLETLLKINTRAYGVQLTTSKLKTKQNSIIDIPIIALCVALFLI